MEESGKQIRRTFEFKQKRTNPFALILLFVLTLGSFLIPISSITFGGLSIGAIFVSLVFLMIGTYFSRMFLWNWKGMEVLDITDEVVTQTFDYKYFRDQNSLPNNGLKMNALMNDDLKDVAETLDSGVNSNEKNQVSLVANEDERIDIHTALDQSTIREISRLLR